MPPPFRSRRNESSSADDWSLIKFKDLQDVAGTNNARKVAGVLDPAIDAGQSGWLVDRVVTVGGDSAMRSLLNQMSGELYATLSAVGVQNTTNLYRVLGDRLRPDPAGLSAPQAAFSNVEAGPDDMLAGNLHFCGGQQPDNPSRGDSAWGGWAVGYGLAGRASADDNAQGVDYSTGGMLVAIERSVDFASRFGVFYGYGGSNISRRRSSKTPISTAPGRRLSLPHARRRLQPLAGSFGSDGYRARRSIAFDATPEIASGDHRGWQSAVYVERGRSLQGQRWSLQPYGRCNTSTFGKRRSPNPAPRDSISTWPAPTSTVSAACWAAGSLRRLREHDAKTTDLTFRTLWMHEFLRQTTGLVTTNFASRAPIRPSCSQGSISAAIGSCSGQAAPIRFATTSACSPTTICSSTPGRRFTSAAAAFSSNGDWRAKTPLPAHCVADTSPGPTGRIPSAANPCSSAARW